MFLEKLIGIVMEKFSIWKILLSFLLTFILSTIAVYLLNITSETFTLIITVFFLFVSLSFVFTTGYFDKKKSTKPLKRGKK